MSNTPMIILKYTLLIFIGALLILLCSTFQNFELPKAGQYYYSSFLRNNYTVFCAIIFLLVGVIIGYYFKLNPWYSGLFLTLIFPLTVLYEASIYRGSHNLLPFELVIYFIFSLPAIFGVYVGKFIFKEIKK
jgi:hypothetical protein